MCQIESRREIGRKPKDRKKNEEKWKKDPVWMLPQTRPAEGVCDLTNLDY